MYSIAHYTKSPIFKRTHHAYKSIYLYNSVMSRRKKENTYVTRKPADTCYFNVAIIKKIYLL